MLRSIRRWAAIAVSLVALWLAPSADAGTIVADSGFRPTVNGFSFANYGEGNADLGPKQVRLLFGRRVCSQLKGGRCTLSPVADAWMQDLNEAMDDGHCYGFSTLALLRFKGQFNPFGLAQTFDLELDDNEALQRTIAYAFTWQTLKAIQNRRVVGTPNEILDFLRSNLAPASTETWTMAIFQRDGDGGHAITPYAVEDMGNGLFDVLVYDNNWPTEERRLHIDTNANTWEYVAAQNPSQPGSLYEGDAETKSLSLWPTTPGLGTHPCSICAGRHQGGSSYNELRLEGNPADHSHLRIVDRAGRTTGYVGGRLVNQIPGAVVLPQMGALWRRTPEPVYRIPRHVHFKVIVDGRRLDSADNESLSLIGPGYDAGIDNIRISPGERATIELSPRGRSLRYRGSRGTDSPSVSFGLDTAHTDFGFRVTASEAPADSALRFRERAASGRLKFASGSRRGQRFELDLLVLGKADENEFEGVVRLRRGEAGILDYGAVERRRGRPVVVIRSAHGSVRRTVLLSVVEND